MEAFEFQTSDNESLFVRKSIAIRETAVILFITGIESHGGWYEKTLDFLAGRGISSYCLDRRGSGRSGGNRGDLPSFKRLRNDLEEFTQEVSSKHPGKRLVLAAISWGAKWAINYWSTVRSNPYEKLLLITPGFFRLVDLEWGTKITAALASIGNPEMLFPIPIPTESFTTSPVKLNFLKEDIFRLKNVTARFLRVNLELDLFLRSLKGVFPQPLYLFEAGVEKIVNNEKNQEFIRQHFFDLRIMHYLHHYHTLEFEEGISYREDLTRAVLS